MIFHIKVQFSDNRQINYQFLKCQKLYNKKNNENPDLEIKF